MWLLSLLENILSAIWDIPFFPKTNRNIPRHFTYFNWSMSQVVFFFSLTSENTLTFRNLIRIFSYFTRDSFACSLRLSRENLVYFFYHSLKISAKICPCFSFTNQDSQLTYYWKTNFWLVDFDQWNHEMHSFENGSDKVHW